MKNLVRLFMGGIFLLSLYTNSISAAPIYRQAVGADATAIQATVDQFRSDLGTNNGSSGSSITGRREINWDFLPDGVSAPNLLLHSDMNSVWGRGVIFNNTTFEAFGTGHPQNRFMASADSGSGTPVRFGNINANYPAIFKTFSGERLFTVWNSHIIEINFFIPYTQIPATVGGFGAVFADVDALATPGTSIWCYDAYGNLLASANVSAANNGLSFLGVSFNEGERVARVVVKLGNAALSSSNNDGTGGVDVVAMDDIIFGEPRAKEFHAGDFDGDGAADAAVFRPSNGTFYVLNSGRNTVNYIPFGQNGDIPVSGDFDGDRRADAAVFRPASGEWWVYRSSNAAHFAVQFGQSGDKPTPGDFDKDGKTDIAFWRPSNGNYYVIRSNNGSYYSFPWGQAGDIPILGGAQQ